MDKCRCIMCDEEAKNSRRDSVLKEIVDHIVKTVQEESVLNGFQYIVSYESIEKELGVKLFNEYTSIIKMELETREEVADVEMDNHGFDVALCTDYAPNYCKDDYEG